MPELLVTKARGEFVAAVVGAAIIVSSLTLAIRNVIHDEAVLPSVVWIVLVALVALSNIRASGMRGFSLGILSAFSRYRLLRVSTQPQQSRALEVGFKLWNLHFVEQKISGDDVVCVRWSTGQGTDLAGHDVNDWSVFLWYRHRDSQKEAKESESGRKRPGQSVIVIGPARAKRITEALGNRVLEFLSASGISGCYERSVLAAT